MALVADNSKAVALLLWIYCLLVLPLFIGEGGDVIQRPVLHARIQKVLSDGVQL